MADATNSLLNPIANTVRAFSYLLISPTQGWVRWISDGTKVEVVCFVDFQAEGAERKCTDARCILLGVADVNIAGHDRLRQGF